MKIVEISKRLSDIDFPTNKKEEWKYSKLKQLQADDFVVQTSNKIAFEKTSIPFDAYVIEIFNGEVVAIDSKLQKGLNISKIEKNIIEDENKHFFAEINKETIKSGVSIEVSENVSLEKPIIIISKTNSLEENLLYSMQNKILLKENSSATILEYFIGENCRYLSNNFNKVDIEKNAVLKMYKVQKESLNANHISLNEVNLFEKAKYEYILVQNGSKYARQEAIVSLLEENAHANFDVAYSISGETNSDIFTQSRHIKPETFSDQIIKGVLYDKSRGSFQGKIHIAKNAIHTIGNQMHATILLSDDAEANCKPELEIYADDVKCSHGATSGVLNEEMLFYMRSRGINEAKAKEILIEAYLDEIISKVDDERIYSWIKGLLR